MASLENIRNAVDELPDGELRHICVEIVQAVSRRLKQGSGANSTFWTIGSLADCLGIDARDPSLRRSLQLLVVRRDAKLLDVHYIYFDPQGRYPEGQMVEDELVASAYESGSFEDPDTGELIADFERLLEPFFVPAKSLEIRR